MIIDEIDALRRRGVVWITLAGWATTCVLAMVALSLGTFAWTACFASILANLAPSLCAAQRRSDAWARIVVALMAAVQPALLLYAMRGGAWQLDMHMFFFVALASLSILCDIRPIIFASALIALHHLVLSYLAPSWVFSGGGGIGRVAVHALAVTLQASILSAIAIGLTATLRRLGTARDEMALLAQTAHDSLAKAQSERELREQLQRDQVAARRAELLELGEAFECTVSRVSAALADTAQLLDDTTESLDTIARATGDQALEVARASSHITTGVQRVADNLSELAGSIRSISINAGQQDDLTRDADSRSVAGAEALNTLAERSAFITKATRSISRIADQTNMLALNATIEASAAGAAGKGFAVVAQEVKSLATQAAAVTDDIDTLLNGIRKGTRDAADGFSDITRMIAELSQTASGIRRDVDNQRVLSEGLETIALTASDEATIMAERTAALAEKAGTTRTLSGDLKSAATTLMMHVRSLETSSVDFLGRMKEIVAVAGIQTAEPSPPVESPQLLRAQR